MKHSLTALFGIQYPIIQAGMAGGPTSPRLVSAVSEAGGLGTLGAGYLMPSAITNAIGEIRKRTRHPFAVNLFLPEEYEYRAENIEEMRHFLQPFRKSLGLEDTADALELKSIFDEQLQRVIEAEVPIVSFTFNAPSSNVMTQLKDKGIKVIATATSVEEACTLENLGVDAVCAQGSEAGGHRGTFIGKEEDSLIGSMALIPQIADAVSIPVIASGGIMDGRGVAASMALGASGVQLGTVFLTTEESGAHPLHKKAILQAKETGTALTKAFSGKMARGLHNEFMDVVKGEIPPYPLQNALTSEIRKTAAAKGKPEWMSLWAGQGVALSQMRSAEEVMKSLVGEANKIMGAFEPL